MVVGGKTMSVDVDWCRSDPRDYNGYERMLKDEGGAVEHSGPKLC